MSVTLPEDAFSGKGGGYGRAAPISSSYSPVELFARLLNRIAVAGDAPLRCRNPIDALGIAERVKCMLYA